jgi:hypothetical protein
MGMMNNGFTPDEMPGKPSGLFEVSDKKQKEDGINDV